MSKVYIPEIPVEFTLGEWDEDAITAFTCGHCHSLATVIHEETEWQMCLFGGKTPREAWHYAVLTPNGMVLDILGLQTPEEAFEEWGAEPVPTTLFELEVAIAKGDWHPEIRRDLADPFKHQVIEAYIK